MRRRVKQPRSRPLRSARGVLGATGRAGLQSPLPPRRLRTREAELCPGPGQSVATEPSSSFDPLHGPQRRWAARPGQPGTRNQERLPAFPPRVCSPVLRTQPGTSQGLKPPTAPRRPAGSRPEGEGRRARRRRGVALDDEEECHGRGRPGSPGPCRPDRGTRASPLCPAAPRGCVCTPDVPSSQGTSPRDRPQRAGRESPCGSGSVTSGSPKRRQRTPLAGRIGALQRARPLAVQPGAHLLFCLTASFCDCAGAAQPSAVSPSPVGASEIPSPPRRTGVSAAGRREAGAPALPGNVTRRVTLALGSEVTIPRGPLVLEGREGPHVAEDDIAPLSGASVVGAAGQFVTPRLIDVHSHLGGYPTPGRRAPPGRQPTAATVPRCNDDQMTEPMTPHAKTADAFWPQDPGIERAVAGGVTTIQVLSGSGNLIN